MRRKAERAARALCALLLALTATTFGNPIECFAHERTVSYSRWGVAEDGEVTAEFRLSRLALSAFAGVGAVALLDRDVRVTTDAGPCDRLETFAEAGTDQPGWRRYRARWRCDDSAPLILRNDLFFDVLPSHLHFARFEVGGNAGVDRVLTDGQRVWALPATNGAGPLEVESRGTSFVEYVVFGIDHISTGYDHLAFVFALLLLATSIREVAGLVTSFTLAHSLTLAAAVFGWIRPFFVGVEAILGFSIALVAIENGWLLAGQPRTIPVAVVAGLGGMACLWLFGVGNLPLAALVGLALFAGCHFALSERGKALGFVRAFVAFAFGLIHGFGFAGVLAQTPGGSSIAALVGFNLGVEAGQMAMVAVAWPLLRLARRAGVDRLVAESGSAVVAGLGLFWFLVRVYG